MMLRATATLLLLSVSSVASAGTKPWDDPRKSVALLGVKRGAGVTLEQLSTVEDLLLSALERTNRFRVIGGNDLSAILSVEAQKQAAGCSDVDCAAELAGALGTQYIATAGVGRLGTVTVISLKLIELKSATVLLHGQQTVERDADLVAAADTLARQAAAATFPPMRVARRWGIAGMIVGVVTAVIGGVLALNARNRLTELRMNSRPGNEVDPAVQTINSIATDATILGSVGGAVTIGGATLTVAF